MVSRSEIEKFINFDLGNQISDVKTRIWNFHINDYDLLHQKMIEMKPEVTFQGIPSFLMKVINWSSVFCTYLCTYFYVLTVNDTLFNYIIFLILDFQIFNTNRTRKKANCGPIYD